MAYLYCFLFLFLTEYLSSKHLKVKFSLNIKKDGYLHFLNVKIFLEQINFQLKFVENRSPVGLLTPSKALTWNI